MSRSLRVKCQWCWIKFTTAYPESQKYCQECAKEVLLNQQKNQRFLVKWRNTKPFNCKNCGKHMTILGNRRLRKFCCTACVKIYNYKAKQQ